MGAGKSTSGRPSTGGVALMPGSRPVTPRGERTRASLVDAARALFEKQGYLDTSVADIAKRAKVAHGTFYTYFDSKEDVFAEVAELLLADFQRSLHEQPELPPGHQLSERIERTNRGYLRAYEECARMMAVLEQVSTFNPRLSAIRRSSRRYWVQRNTEAIGRWQAGGLVDPSLEPDYAASILGSMVDRSAYLWIVLGEPYDFDEAVAQITRLYCNALRIECHLDDPGRAARS